MYCNKTSPFSYISTYFENKFLQILSIEVNHSDGKKIDTFMKSKGYKLVQQIPSPSEPQDNIYSKI